MPKLLFVFITGCISTSTPGPCASKTADLRSEASAETLQVDFVNLMDISVKLVWVDFSGVEIVIGEMSPWGNFPSNTFVRHAVRFYTGVGYVLVSEHRITSDNRRIEVKACEETIQQEKERVQQKREQLVASYPALVHDQQAPCSPSGRSSLWSCVRHVPSEEYLARSSDLYGFVDKQEAGLRKVGEMYDHGYVGHINEVPRLTNGPGYLKMNFTQVMRDTILPWYQANKHMMTPHEAISGGYTNIHVNPMDKLDLDVHPDIRLGIIDEMKGVLEWWTGEKNLVHTATFGARIYRRGSMLINHVDRDDTHLASAVIQVQQEVDDDGGWPLEICADLTQCVEVYLQPGEMVLYEGGKVRHGRPMRLRGGEFANVFSHFAPQGWHGAGKSPKWNARITTKAEL